MLVVGCKGVSSGDTDAWIENGNRKKVWEKTNSSTTEYLRAYEQFGTTTKPKNAEVKLTVGNAANSKAGLIFDLKKNDNGTINYFVVGVGTQAADGKTPEYYISYYSGVTADSIAQTSSGEAAPQGNGKVETVVNNTKLNGIALAADGSLTAYVKFSSTKDETSGKPIITVDIGSGTDKYGQNEQKIELNKYDSGAAEIDGGIAAYAMLRPTVNSGSSVSTTNTYEVIEPSVIASAEDAE